jgi:uncharacterized protein (TIGR02246 family)
MRAIYQTLLFSILVLPIHVFAGEAPLRTEVCVTVEENQVISFFDRWNNSLKSKDPEKVAENYAEKAVLLPTLANEPRIGRAQIKDYFLHFLKKNPVATVNQRIIEHGCNWATDTGLYTFQTTVAGEKRDVKARYSYVYENIDGKWLIIHHHSSLMPLPAASEKGVAARK